MPVKSLSIICAITACTIALHAATASASSEPIVIPLEAYADQHWTFRAKLKDGREQLFVMDTGGGLTVLSIISMLKRISSRTGSSSAI